MPVQTEWLEKDYYDVLGVAETASDKDIQRAYRRLARQFHPDANPDDPGAEERFKAISAAYDVVGDADRRKEYDEVRRLGPMTDGFAPGGAGGAGAGFSFRVEDLGDLDGLFGNLFGHGSGANAARCGRDLEAEVRLRFEDAVLGTTTQLPLDGRPGPIKVRIPPGVDDGQLIRLPGRGDPGRNGGPPGDLFVAVRVEPHRLFGRSGRNLTITVPVTYPEAALGADIKVPTLEGAPVTVRIPPGTPSGRTLRVRGHGVVDPAGGRGDLLVSVEVAVPSRLTEPEREAVAALAEANDTNVRAHLGV